MMKKQNKYQDVKTMEDLEVALHSTREPIAAQGEEVHGGLVRVQEYYTPRNLALQGVKRFAWEHNLFVIGLNAVRGLKKLLQK
jgi:hypothetical protein